MEYRIVEHEQQHFKVYREIFNVAPEDENHTEIPLFWKKLADSGKLAALERDHTATYGICRPIDGTLDAFEYGVGVRIDAAHEGVESDQALWVVEAQTYLVFECKGETPDAIGTAWHQFLTNFIPTAPYVMAVAPDFERYPHAGPKDLFCELWIPIEKKAK